MHSPRHILTAVAIVLFFQVSGQTYVSGELTSHTTWTEAASPYVITDSLIVGSSAILTLEAGTKIMFKYHPDPVKKSYMVVHGGIRSNGNFENFVVFTSDRDDSVMDLHGDGQATLPRPGDWGYVRFNNTNPGEGEHGLDWTLFRYGGGRNPDSLSLPEYYPMVTFRDEIHIMVSDNGIGIPEDIIHKLFHIDERVTRTGTANEEGTGLGLILCREVARKNHGSIEVSSKPGKGSTFRVRLPKPPIK